MGLVVRRQFSPQLGLRVLVFCCLFASGLTLYAQDLSRFGGVPFVTNYSALTYRAGIQNFDIVQDDLGRVYVANNLGLLEFDGNDWSRY
jgi:hypothetical protein